MKKEAKKNATSKKAVASKSQTNDEILWVWKLTWEDIHELETQRHYLSFRSQSQGGNGKGYLRTCKLRGFRGGGA